MQKRRFIISGGGSGGHIFPAIAIANALKQEVSDANILFVGAKGKMEMEKVPKAGYPIKGLWISGLQRSLTWKNLLFPIKLVSSLWSARRIIKSFRPDVVIGVGGFASGPTLAMAARMGIPTLVQEQNSFPGLTNRWLAGKVDKICVAYSDMQRYFPAEKLIETGNPVRQDLEFLEGVHEARTTMNLAADKKTILIFGGSLGAGTLNEAMKSAYELLLNSDIQVIWQIGKYYERAYMECETAQLENVNAQVFIDDMAKAYAAADLVVCRAGALTIAEISLLGKPTILIPSPNVAEDHQTKNAKSLTAVDAAMMIEDSKAGAVLIKEAIDLVHDAEKLKALSGRIKTLARPHATKDIVRVILNM